MVKVPSTMAALGTPAPDFTLPDPATGEEICRDDTELRGNRWQQFIGGRTSLMELAIEALCNSGQIEHMSMILDLVEEHDEVRIRRHCIECLIGDPVTEMFGGWKGIYL